ncbi:hypothetical protein N9164_03800 [Draconibacterium sp.]|nr:hypothetical protein [Draconibacterium sp.]
MKRILSITGILALAVLFMSAISINDYPQDPPQKKKKKHIKMVKVDDDGKKMELDTVIEADEIFVWNGDTIGGGKELKWVAEGDFDMDFDFDIEKDGEGNVFIMKSKDGKAPAFFEFKTDGDEDEDIMFWGDEDHNKMILHAPHVVGVPHAPKVIRIRKQKSGNAIDLNDPGIISYDKKELKNGREKITIVRNKPVEGEEEIHEEIIMHGTDARPMIIHEGHPGKSKSIKVISNKDGNIEIIEDGAIWHVEEGDSDVQVIEKDGKKITIKKIKEGEEIKVDVEVEEENEEEHKEENVEK